MNKYSVVCEVCEAEYQDGWIGKLKKLIHPGYNPDNPADSRLPTARCTAVLDYVRFADCGHCCPERFTSCPECVSLQQRPYGKPSEKMCGE